MPFLVFKQKYRNSIPARFFLFKNPRFDSAKIHFHACSFGEIQALRPILKEFDSKSISVITQTGFDLAKKECENVRFLPFEIFLPFWLRDSKMLVIFEAELWFMLVLIARLKKSRVILINARISERSYKRYMRFRFLYTQIFKYIDMIYAQTLDDKKRLKALGARKITVCGNIKAAFLPKPTKLYQKPDSRVIVLASTHDKEEELILNSLQLQENDKIIVAPRHPERFDKVASFLLEWKKQHSFARFSETMNFDCKITLLDTLGDLLNIYAISDVVILGGSFLPNIGGHNPIECAQFNPVLISGEYIFNQEALFKLLDGINFAKASEIPMLLKQDLQKCKISQKADASIILDDIKEAYAK